MECAFTYDHYREILSALRGTGARFLRFGQPGRRRKPCVWLRHDVDMDPEATLPLAEIEAELGLPATYFIQLTSPFYNAVAPDTVRVIRRLHALGHEVGLHLSLHAYPSRTGSIAALARHEAGLLAAITGQPVRVLSFHRPTRDLLGRSVRGFICAYGPAYFLRSKYLSDSRGRWREGCACGQIAAHRRLQLLTHGEWWAETHGDQTARLNWYRQRQREQWESAVAAEVLP